MSFAIENKLNWLYVDINSYFATVEQQVNPDLRNKPVAVVPMLSDSTCAIAASYEAKIKGINTGTKIYEAKKLCPELICIQSQHSLYARYFLLFYLAITYVLCYKKNSGVNTLNYLNAEIGKFKAKFMMYGYVRVGTKEQSVKNQKSVIC